jgi:hypothetical protein
MLGLIIWRIAMVVEALLLYRAVSAKLFMRYSAFYAYVLSMFLSDVLVYVLNLEHAKSYDKWSWYCGFLTLFLGCGIILEVFKHVLSLYAGAEKLARIVTLGAIAAILCFAVLYLIWSPSTSVARAVFTTVQRDFVLSQAILLLVLLQVISYYGISMGRNLKGMILGYGQCIGVTLATLALRAYLGVRFHATESYIQQISYLIALAIWVVALWSYCPNPVAESKIGPEADYEALASRTRDMIGAAGSELVKAERL